MKPVVVLAVIVASSFAAPVEENEELLRTKKSYGAPCTGAAPYTPVSLYLNQGPHYREEEHFEDHARSGYESGLAGLSYSGGGASSAGYGSASSGGHSAGASSGYGSAASGSAASLAGAGLALSGAGAGSHGPAVGLFPNAIVGGCNIPLLLSCAPNVVAGHLAASHGYSGYSAPAYRSEEEAKMEWAKMARTASHHKISEDFPELQTAPASHHVVSQDFPEPNLTRVVPIQSIDNTSVKSQLQ